MTSQPGATPIRDLSALKEQHPEAHLAWVAEGVNLERERIRSHLQMAKLTPTGAPGRGLRIAIEAIESGAALDAEHMQRYTEAAANQRDIDARMADDENVIAAVNGAAQVPADDSFGAQVARRFEELTGVKHG